MKGYTGNTDNSGRNMEKTKTDECITGSSGTPGTPTRRQTSEIPRMRSAFSFLAVKIAVCRADCARRPCGLVGGKKSSSLRSGIFSENLACGGAPLSCPRIGNDGMFHINKEYNEDNDRIKKEETDMENYPHTAHGTWFQLSLHAGSISRVGGCRHRLLQGILPVPLRDSLPPGNTGHHRRHTEFSNLLII